MALVLGYFLFACMGGLYTVIAAIYPTEVRNTGTGFAIGMGRFGAVVGPYLAGLLLGAPLDGAADLHDLRAGAVARGRLARAALQGGGRAAAAATR